jgi:hypothetical protein
MRLNEPIILGPYIGGARDGRVDGFFSGLSPARTISFPWMSVNQVSGQASGDFSSIWGDFFVSGVVYQRVDI